MTILLRTPYANCKSIERHQRFGGAEENAK